MPWYRAIGIFFPPNLHLGKVCVGGREPHSTTQSSWKRFPPHATNLFCMDVNGLLMKSKGQVKQRTIQWWMDNDINKTRYLLPVPIKRAYAPKMTMASVERGWVNAGEAFDECQVNKCWELNECSYQAQSRQREILVFRVERCPCMPKWLNHSVHSGERERLLQIWAWTKDGVWCLLEE